MSSISGVVQTWPRRLLQVEGATIFAATIWAYSRSDRSWWLFLGGILLPDLGMVGYALNTRIGAAIYNAAHTETAPVVLLCAAYAQNSVPMISAALIWLAHINMDRMCGFGLKYGTGFGHTHLGKL